MPIIQQNPAWATALGGLAGIAGGIMQGNAEKKERKRKEAREDARDAQQKLLIQMQVDKAKDDKRQFNIEHGLDPETGQPAKPGVTQGAPGIAALLSPQSPTTPNVTAVTGPGGTPMPVVSGGAPKAPTPPAAPMAPQTAKDFQSLAGREYAMYSSTMAAVAKVQQQIEDLPPGATALLKPLRDQITSLRGEATAHLTAFKDLTGHIQSMNRESREMKALQETIDFHKATMKHWSAQAQQQFHEFQTRIAVEVANHQLTHQDAQARIGVEFARMAQTQEHINITHGEHVREFGITHPPGWKPPSSKPPKVDTAPNHAAVEFLKASDRFKTLPPGVGSYILQSVQKNGQEKVVKALRGLAAGTAQDPNLTKEQAQQALDRMGL